MSLRTFDRAGYRWHLSDDLAAFLLGEKGLRLDEWTAQNSAECIKHASHRSVYRVTLSTFDIHIKFYRDDGRERLRRLFRSARAKAEYDIGKEVARRGISTLEVLGYGESRSLFRRSESYLITRTLPETISLLDYLETVLPTLPCGYRTRQQQTLAASIGAFLAQIHQAGICHTDLHPGNVLLRFEQGKPELFLIDLHAVRLSHSLSWKESLRNLAVLNRWFALRAGRSDRRRAWQSYCRMRRDLRLDERATAREVERATRSSLLDFAHDQDPRCLGGNRHYQSLRRPGIKGHAVRDVRDNILHPLLDDSEGPFTHSATRVLKHSATSTVIEIPSTPPEMLIYKAVRATRWSDPLASLIRTPSALHSYRMGHALRLRGLPTPRPLGVWHRMRLGMLGDGYLLMERLEQAQNLDAFVNQLANLPPWQRRQRLDDVLDELAVLLRTLHDWRMSHRDLKAANLLVSPVGWVLGTRGIREVPPLPGENRDHVWLVDLAGVRFVRWLTRSRRIADISRLHVSFLQHPGLNRPDRLRFLRSYLQWGLFGKGGWKNWWRQIEGAAREKVARNQRRGRIVG